MSTAAAFGWDLHPEQGLGWAYNGKIFCINEDGVTCVLKAGDKLELLGKNPLAEDDMGMASPAIVGDKLLIRTSTRIYCIMN